VEKIGDRYQQLTKYSRQEQQGRTTELKLPPAEKGKGQVINLPQAEKNIVAPLNELLKTRCSVRDYQPKALELNQLSELLWATNGKQRAGQGFSYRTAPSAGALYPLETYLIVNRVAGLDSGVYQYSVMEHSLRRIRCGDCTEAVASAALDQTMCAEAGVVFAWTAVFERSKWKYKQRAYRYVYLDAGHIAQNLALAAVGLGLGSCQIAALYDDEVNQLLAVDGVEESIVYMSSVGYPAI